MAAEEHNSEELAGEPLALPELRTERLVLRAYAMSDLEAVVRVMNDPGLAEMTATLPRQFTVETGRPWLWARMTGRVSSPSGREVVDLAPTFAICLRDEAAGDGCGELVGACGLRVVNAHGRGELGYMIARPHWGKGIATEAARAVTGYGFATLGLRRITADFYARNKASGRVLEKIGFRVEGMQRQHVVRFGRVEDVVLTGVLREEWGEEGSRSSR